VWTDLVPQTKAAWIEPDQGEPLNLDEAEALEEAVSDELDAEEGWTGPVPRYLAAMRAAGAPFRPPRGPGAIGVTYLTREGQDKLWLELDRLKTDRLPALTASLADALSEGYRDEYVTEVEEMRSELAHMGDRIRVLERLLAAAELLHEPDTTDTIQIGSQVTVVEQGFDPESYRIVGPVEADPSSGYVSHASPLGQALMGRKIGDQVEIETPDGPVTFRITGIG
jgi:transcription elongation factor GreA